MEYIWTIKAEKDRLSVSVDRPSLPLSSRIWIKNFKHTRVQISGSYLRVTGAENISIWMCPGAHKIMHYTQRLKKLVAGLKTAEIEILER